MQKLNREVVHVFLLLKNVSQVTFKTIFKKNVHTQ